ncbi:hypothetical protein IU474_26525 [Nocardia otitidiscaviarum]|uniref:hypothetical protein n=1 Tax=Nocardia otitidiscaviarum TaxID=1823 RepID=UPI0018956881|nr:hypothetical protein [Nocardia otitidiscaviarum]MBF6240605.1 hypothetical protein [Nocardia otitidiscaviarum]
MPPTSGKAQLFTDRDYGGASATLETGTYNMAGSEVGDDSLSSLQVAPGYAVTVYALADCQGASSTFTTDTAYVGDAFNDTISSVRVDTAGSSSTGAPEQDQQVVFVQPPSY